MEQILEAAWEDGIRSFDTATAYGRAPGCLARWLRAQEGTLDVEVIIKVDPDGPGLVERIEAAVSPFSGTRVVVLAHRPVTKSGWDRLHDAASHVGATAGVSVYDAEEVRAGITLRGIARLQLPCNIFDPAALRARGGATVPVDARSVWLQGILLEPPDVAERRVPGAGRLSRAVSDAAAAVGADPAALLLAVVASDLTAPDRIVIGVDHPDQLNPVRTASRLEAVTVDRFRSSVRRATPDPIDRRVLDPRRWGLS